MALIAQNQRFRIVEFGPGIANTKAEISKRFGGGVGGFLGASPELPRRANMTPGANQPWRRPFTGSVFPVLDIPEMELQRRQRRD